MELVHGTGRSDPGRPFAFPLASYIPISVDLSFILSVVTFSVASKNLELNFFPCHVTDIILPVWHFCLELPSAQVLQASDSLPSSGRRLFESSSYEQYHSIPRWCLKFIAFKIYSSHAFPPCPPPHPDCCFLSSIFIWSWLCLSLPYVFCLWSHSLLSPVCSFLGVLFHLNLNSYWVTCPHLTFWLGPLEIFVLPEFLALVSLSLSPFFLFFPIWPFSQLHCLCIQASYLSLPFRWIV